MYYYVIIFCCVAGIVKGLFFAEKNVKPSNNLLDFLIPGLYQD